MGSTPRVLASVCKGPVSVCKSPASEHSCVMYRANHSQVELGRGCKSCTEKCMVPRNGLSAYRLLVGPTNQTQIESVCEVHVTRSRMHQGLPSVLLLGNAAHNCIQLGIVMQICRKLDSAKFDRVWSHEATGSMTVHPLKVQKKQCTKVSIHSVVLSQAVHSPAWKFAVSVR